MTSAELEQTLGILEKIAGGFPANSAESKAIGLAAEALLFAFHKSTQEAFMEFLSHRDQPLTPAQILHLRAIGIEPEESDGGE